MKFRYIVLGALILTNYAHCVGAAAAAVVINSNSNNRSDGLESGGTFIPDRYSITLSPSTKSESVPSHTALVAMKAERHFFNCPKWFSQITDPYDITNAKEYCRGKLKSWAKMPCYEILTLEAVQKIMAYDAGYNYAPDFQDGIKDQMNASGDTFDNLILNMKNSKYRRHNVDILIQLGASIPENSQYERESKDQCCLLYVCIVDITQYWIIKGIVPFLVKLAYQSAPDSAFGNVRIYTPPYGRVFKKHLKPFLQGKSKLMQYIKIFKSFGHDFRPQYPAFVKFINNELLSRHITSLNPAPSTIASITARERIPV